MFELNVPFLEKDNAKELGARWNAKIKKWYVPSGIDPELFRKWWPADVEYTNENLDVEKTNGCNLSIFLQKIQKVIQNSFPNREWIIAEISEMSFYNGHCFITLVEYDENGHKQAQISARIWSAQASKVLAKFKEATNSDLVAGIKVLLLVTVSFNTQYGLSLNIDDIDPNYTLGDMIAKINKIKETLEKEQIFNRNKILPVPLEFTRIAVISPVKAAGLGDFNREAELLKKYNLCNSHYFTATFQGKSSSIEIVNAIKLVEEQHKITPFDAVVIIRGGGSVADLAWLNDLDLARAICLCPLYIMVGVGHKRDYTILDEIAAGRFDTPSKVIAYIFQVIIRNAENASYSFQDLMKLVKNALEFSYQDIASSWQQIIESIKQKLIIIEQDCESLIREILCQDPSAILKKGFVIASSLKDKIITSYKAALENKIFKLTFHDGTMVVSNNVEEK